MLSHGTCIHWMTISKLHVSCQLICKFSHVKFRFNSIWQHSDFLKKNSEKIRLDISYELSALQTILRKCQALFSLRKDIVEYFQLQLWMDLLTVNTTLINCFFCRSHINVSGDTGHYRRWSTGLAENYCVHCDCLHCRNCPVHISGRHSSV